MDALKQQIATPTVLNAVQFEIPPDTYVAAVLRESFLPEPRLRIFMLIGSTLTEVYEAPGGGEELIDLLLMHLTGNKIAEIVTIWTCGQRGLKCITVYAWENNTRRFRQIFDAQASQIEFGPKHEGKPVAIGLLDAADSPTKKLSGRRVYIWQNGRFVRKTNLR